MISSLSKHLLTWMWKKTIFQYQFATNNQTSFCSSRDVDGVIESANNTEFGLASGVFTSNLDKAHCTALSYITLHYPALSYITLHYPTLHCITLHYLTLSCITLHYPALPYITLHYPALPCITLHYPTLPCITLHSCNYTLITILHSWVMPSSY